MTSTCTVANIFLGSAVEGRNIQASVDAPRFHQQYLSDVVNLEHGFDSVTLANLRALGYTLKVGRGWGDGECIAADPMTGELEGGQDHRDDFGKAAGY